MFQEPIHFMQDNIQQRRVRCWTCSMATTPSSIRRWPSITACRRSTGDNDTLGAGRQCRQIWPRRHPAHGGVHDRNIRRACAPARSSAATGWCRRCWASACRRRRRWCPNCPAMNPRPTCRSARCWPSITRIPFCAGCHQRFDSFGLAFEGYGPVGDARTKDLAGRPVDASATYPGRRRRRRRGGPARPSSSDHRQDNFVDNLAASCWPMR